MGLILIILYSLILVASMFYIMSKLIDKKYNFRDFKLYVSYFFIVFFSIFNYYYVSSFIRVILVIVEFSILIMFLFKENLKKAITTAIYYELIIVISEGIFALTMNLLFNMNSKQFVETQFGNFNANVAIALISILVINFKLVKRIYKFINTVIDKLNEKHLVIMCLITTIVINILEATLYYRIDFRYLLVINIFLILFCFAIVLYSFNTKNKYNRVYDKYNTTLNSLKEYETILDKYKIINHENKNELLTIRNMMPKTNKKVISYIDNLVENKIKDNDKIMLDVSIIPTGGLRGLIYSKLLLMNEQKIDYRLKISKEVKTVTLINLDDSLMLDICKIIGVYMDNAIQAVCDLRKKYINIEMYIEDKNLIISICNNYEGNVEVDKINQKGYTTKGKNHGFGLTLVKQILDNNKKLKNQTNISKKYFTQILKVKL